MNAIRRMVPGWIKEMIVVFLDEIVKMPVRFAVSHALLNYAQNSGCSRKRKESIYRGVQHVTYRYLSGKYLPVIQNLLQDYNPGEKKADAPVWIFWWNGEQQAPAIVKRCIHALKNKSGGHPVTVIDRENYREFADVPKHIEEKLKQKTISLTHFSDYYRMRLLAEQGGLWIDASVFVQTPLSERIFDMPLFTIRNPGQDVSNVSNWEWTVSVFGGWQQNTLFYAVSQLLSAYWADHDCLIDYYIFDHMIRLVVEHSPQIKEDIDAVEQSNDTYYDLHEHMECPADAFSPKQWSGLSCFYKLTWKKDYALITPDGKETVYSRWAKENE